jgi:hypothetical protein
VCVCLRHAQLGKQARGAGGLQPECSQGHCKESAANARLIRSASSVRWNVQSAQVCHSLQIAVYVCYIVNKSSVSIDSVAFAAV